MITLKRIKEAEDNFKNYLAEGLIKKSSNSIAREIFTKNAGESLKAAQLLFKNKHFLWTIITSYYSMFYITNAVLLKLGYKTSDKIVHKVTADALIVLIKPKLKKQILEGYEEIREHALEIAEFKSYELVRKFDYERSKRSKIQYQTTISDIEIKANTSLERAKDFLFEMEKLLDN